MLKVAVTWVFTVRVRLQVEAVPLQEPLHPPKVEPVAAVAVSVTAVP